MTTTTKTLLPSEILHRAADLIASAGWAQGEFRDPQGRFCMLGALNAQVWGGKALHSIAMEEAAAASSARWYLEEVLRANYPEAQPEMFGASHLVPIINDHVMKTAAEAETMLRKAALVAADDEATGTVPPGLPAPWPTLTLKPKPSPYTHVTVVFNPNEALDAIAPWPATPWKKE